MTTITELVDRLPNTFVAKKQVRGILESAGITVDQYGQAIGEFNRLLNARRVLEDAARTASLRESRAREASDKINEREFERAGRDAEIALLKTVEPHWPAYRKMMALCRDLDQLFCAERARDMGDVLAFQGALDAVPAMLSELGVEPDDFAGGIWATICNTRRISEAQMKALATSAAKQATLANKG